MLKIRVLCTFPIQKIELCLNLVDILLSKLTFAYVSNGTLKHLHETCLSSFHHSLNREKHKVQILIQFQHTQTPGYDDDVEFQLFNGYEIRKKKGESYSICNLMENSWESNPHARQQNGRRSGYFIISVSVCVYVCWCARLFCTIISLITYESQW